MPKIKNSDILGRILRSTIGVISRRTSEAYANIIVNQAINNLTNKYPFLEYVQILDRKYSEVFDVLKIEEELEDVDPKEVGKLINEFIIHISNQMGKDAGYYFIKEINEDIPFDYEEPIEKIGVDLEYLQNKFITDVKESFKFKLYNNDIVKYMFTLFFEVLDQQTGRDKAYKLLDEIIDRISIEHPVLNKIKINDVRSIQGVDIVTVDNDINQVDSETVGNAIQKMIQDINSNTENIRGFSFIDRLRNKLNPDYNFNLREMGVNIDVIKLKQGLLLNHVLKALVEVLSDSTTESYATLIVNNVLRKIESKFSFLKGVEIDSVKFSEGLDAVTIPDDVESVRESELGRGIQRIIETVSVSLGDDAGEFFLDRFKRNLGKAYVTRMEEIGVNLHMVQLRRNLMW